MSLHHPKVRRAAIAFILVTAVLDIVAMGIVIPVLPHLIEEFVGNTRCLVLSETPQIADRIDEFTVFWNIKGRGNLKDK